MPLPTAIKVQENRVRRTAQRRGLKLMKSRRRDERATDFDRYAVKDPNRDLLVFGFRGDAFTARLDDVEAWLNG